MSYPKNFFQISRSQISDLKTDNVDYLKKPPWKKNFFDIFAIHSSSRHKKRCQMSVRLFSLFRGSIYQQWGVSSKPSGKYIVTLIFFLFFEFENVELFRLIIFSFFTGMLHGGLSLAIFEEWCTSEQNMIIMPGYCVSGTVGHKILNGTRKIEFKKGKPLVEVKMSVQYMSFSAHADAKGQLISEKKILFSNLPKSNISALAS